MQQSYRKRFQKFVERTYTRQNNTIYVTSHIDRNHFWEKKFWKGFYSMKEQGCRAGTGTGWNSIYLGSPEREPYSKYGSGSGYKKKWSRQLKKNLHKFEPFNDENRKSSDWAEILTSFLALIQEHFTLGNFFIILYGELCMYVNLTFFKHFWQCTVKKHLRK